MKRRTASVTERERRHEQEHADTCAVVKTGKCPICGGALRQNLSIFGWWQCENLGAIGFRKDASKPECTWQGFTQ